MNILLLVTERTAKQAKEKCENAQLVYDTANKLAAEQDANKAVCTAARKEIASQKKIADD